MRRVSWRTALVIVTVMAAVAVVLLAGDDAWARAGGGGHFSGGGGGGGGGGRGGGGFSGGRSRGSGGAVSLSAWHIPVSIVILLLLYYASRKSTSAYRGNVIRRGSSLADLRRRDSNLAALRAEDPAFDPGAFLSRVQTAFHKIQSAWCAQDLSPVRPFISDGVGERFSLQFEEQKAMGIRDHMEAIQTYATEIAQVELDEHFQQIAVRIRASARDYEVSLADGRRVGGSATAEQFVEIWSFLRRRGAATKQNAAGLIEGNCPNCGGAIEMNQSANCRYCGAALRSGEYDWVLVEITQECEWSPQRDASVQSSPGIVALRQADAGFNLQQIEDTASVMFWRKNMADRLGVVDPLRKMATPEFCDRYSELLRSRTMSQGQHAFYGRCGVGSVRTLGAIVDAARSLVLVEVHWSGTRYLVEGDARIGGGGQEILSKMLLALSRKAGATSNLAEAIASAHCPGCGAPESNSAASTCEFCGHVLNDPSRWLLEDALDSHSPRAAQLLALAMRASDDASAPPAAAASGGLSAMGLLAWMIRAVLADGQIDPRERAWLEKAAQRRGVPPQRVAQLIEAAGRGELEVAEPRNPAETREWLEAMAAIAMADGKLSAEEQALLRHTARSYQLSKYDLTQLLKRVRAKLYADARQQLRRKQ